MTSRIMAAMTITREELHALVDRVPVQQLDQAASALAALSDQGIRRRLPRSLASIERRTG